MIKFNTLDTTIYSNNELGELLYKLLLVISKTLIALCNY